MSVTTSRHATRLTLTFALGMALAAGRLAGQVASGAQNDALRNGMPGWLKLSGEIRGRAEFPAGLGFVRGADDSYYLHRLRLNAAITPFPWLSAVVQVQDSQVLGYASKPAPSTIADTLDLRQGYLEFGSAGGRWNARAGRQHIAFGDNRLVASSNWGNVGPAWDAFRLSYAKPGTRLDWFASTMVVPVNGRFNRPRAATKLHGFYSSFTGRQAKRLIEPYLFWKSASQVVCPRGLSGAVDVFTYGFRSTGKLPARFDWNVEIARQSGRRVGEAIHAWAGHWEIGYRLWGAETAPRAAFEHNYSSGDRDPNDGKWQSFDQHYPTNKFGNADTIAWRNIRELASEAEWKPNRSWTMRAAYQSFWLATRQDGLYSYLGPRLALNRLADSSRVGQQFDVRAIGQLSGQFQIYFGFGRFFPGPYMKQSTKGSPVSFPYIMWTYTF